MGRIRRASVLAGAVTLAALTASTWDTTAATPAQTAGVSVDSNRPGRMGVRMGTCKYGVQGPVGFLQAVIWPPNVAAPNLRRGVVDATWARYRAVLVDANSGTPLWRTRWSGWLRAVDNEFRTWTGKTVLAKWDWRGNYVVRVKVEWWNSTRKLGQKWWALHRYGYLNEYNVGPFGPMTTCFKANTAGWVIIEVPTPPWP